MTPSLLALLVAGSFSSTPDSDRAAQFREIAIVIAAAIEAPPTPAPAAVGEPTVRDVPFYYDDLRPVTAPSAPLLVTYDWRTPVIFDLP